MWHLGDYIKTIMRDNDELNGILIKDAKDSIALKLSNGYNIGILKNEIKRIKKLKGLEKIVGKRNIKKDNYDGNKKKITIIHTGGTIASKIDYKTGGVTARFEAEELLGLFPELKKLANIKSIFLANMSSEDMRFSHYRILAKAIEREVDSNGIIIAHGTDTLGYTAAALAFMLKNIPIPVILVGSQRSSDRPSSDAAINLICATQFVLNSNLAGVAICMHNSTNDNECVILPATKTRKMHTSTRDAFKSINDEKIALVSRAGKIEFIKHVEKREGKFELLDKMEERVAILRVHPNMRPEQFLFYKNYKGLVIEGTGLGQAPVGVPNKFCLVHKKILNAIRTLIKKGCIVVMTSQCIYGSVQMHVYSNAIELTNAGVIPGEDMLTETAFIKLAWLLGNYKDKREVKRLLRENLVGEINRRHLFSSDNKII